MDVEPLKEMPTNKEEDIINSNKESVDIEDPW